MQARIAELETEIGRLRVLVEFYRLGIVAVIKDTALECRCGWEPYTDAETCPRCTAIEVMSADFGTINKQMTTVAELEARLAEYARGDDGEPVTEERLPARLPPVPRLAGRQAASEGGQS